MSKTTSSSTPACIVVKIGGRPASNLASLDALIRDLGQLVQSGKPVVFVHGGGAEVSSWSKRLGLEPSFVGGKRMTSAPEMDVVEMVLAGSVNSRILRRFLAASVPAVGLSGADSGLFVSRSIDEAAGSKTGEIVSVQPKILIELSSLGYVPVVSSVSCDEQGSTAFNINADDAAMSLAIELKAEALIYLSDIPGVLDGPPPSLEQLAAGQRMPQLIARIDRPHSDELIRSGVISGGMIPKIQGSLDAVARGVGKVVIGAFEQSGDLSALLKGSKGTSIA